MARASEALYELCAGPVGEMGYDLIGVEEVTDRGRRTLRFYIDHADGVSVGDCEKVSRELEYVLEGETEPTGPYAIEVSSPGLDHELVSEREYRHFAGRRVRLVLKEAIGERNVLVGVIVGAHDGSATLRHDDGDEVSVPLTKIARAHLAA